MQKHYSFFRNYPPHSSHCDGLVFVCLFVVRINVLQSWKKPNPSLMLKKIPSEFFDRNVEPIQEPCPQMREILVFIIICQLGQTYMYHNKLIIYSLNCLFGSASCKPDFCIISDF